MAAILLVEDDPDIRESLTEVFTDEGHHVTGASDGLDALAKLGASTSLPDLILLDFRMPRMDGLQFREEQLKVERWARIPVIVLTADRGGTHARSVGAAGHIRKPVELAKLLALVNAAIAGAGSAAG